MYYVYILKLQNGNHYIGYTRNLKTRMQNHSKGKCITTNRIKPLKIIWYSCFNNKKQALLFEKYLKSGSGVEFRRRHLE